MRRNQTTKCCPSCQSENVVSRRGALSVIGFVMLFVVCWMVSSAIPVSTPDMSATKFMISMMATVLTFVFLLAIVLSVVSALFGSNRCKSCGTKWR
jgi:hypothetical protein